MYCLGPRILLKFVPQDQGGMKNRNHSKGREAYTASGFWFELLYVSICLVLKNYEKFQNRVFGLGHDNAAER